MFLDTASRTLFYIFFTGLALFIPFSIAGANFAIGFGILAWLLAIVAAKGRHPSLGKMRHDPLILAALLLVATALVSALLSENRSRAMRDWQEYWLLVIYLIAGFTVATARLRKIAFWVLFASASLSALVALAQAGGGIEIFSLDIKDKFRPSSTLFTMTFAGVFCQLICVNFSLLLREMKWNKSFLILLAGLSVQIVAFLFNRTRGAWLGLFVGLIVVTIIQKKRKALAAGAIALIIIALITILDPTLNARFRSIVGDIHSPHERSIKTRRALWEISLDLIREHPFLGAGMGDFSEEVLRHPKGMYAKSTSDAHNVFLHILATRGLLGFIPFLLFWIVLVRQLLALERRLRAPADSFDHHLVLGALAATAALLVGALTENNIDDSEVLISFLFIIGLARSTQWGRNSQAGK